MEKEYFIQLTKTLYRLTLLFPKKEPLRYRMRTVADDILTNLVSILKGNFHKSADLVHEVERNLEILDSFFEIAKAQNWVSPADVLEIQKEYSIIKEEIETVKNEPEISNSLSKENVNEIEVAKESNNVLNERQQKILEILKGKGKVQVGEMVLVFPQISKRTLRRDFRSLLKRGLIERIGEKNYTFYQIS